QDQTGLIICEKCKKGYHSMRYDVCFSCYKKEKGIDEKDSDDWYEEEDEDDWDYDGKDWKSLDNDSESKK
ncbi:unnamed protein product, partial [marine sediment metagenome]